MSPRNTGAPELPWPPLGLQAVEALGIASERLVRVAEICGVQGMSVMIEELTDGQLQAVLTWTPDKDTESALAAALEPMGDQIRCHPAPSGSCALCRTDPGAVLHWLDDSLIRSGPAVHLQSTWELCTSCTSLLALGDEDAVRALLLAQGFSDFASRAIASRLTSEAYPDESGPIAATAANPDEEPCSLCCVNERETVFIVDDPYLKDGAATLVLQPRWHLCRTCASIVSAGDQGSVSQFMQAQGFTLSESTAIANGLTARAHRD